MDYQRLFYVFYVCFAINISVCFCQYFDGPNNFIGNIVNSFSQLCYAPDWNQPNSNVQPGRLLLYSKRQFHSYPLLQAPSFLMQSPKFNPALTTIIFVSGFRSTPSDKTLTHLAETFARRGGVNFLSYDYDSYPNGDYFQYFDLVRDTGILSRYLGNFLLDLTNLGVSRKNIRMIGYSYGAQLAGVAGLYFRQIRGQPIPRITGLDPITLCFPESASVKLGTGSAQFVDTIQTSFFSEGGGYVGHANYIVNGNGNSQPGCENDLVFCVHERSVDLYAESILRENSLLAVACRNWFDFSNGKCRNNEVSPVGFNSRTDISGTFFIRTAVKSPFGIGLRGLQ